MEKKKSKNIVLKKRWFVTNLGDKTLISDLYDFKSNKDVSFNNQYINTRFSEQEHTDLLSKL